MFTIALVSQKGGTGKTTLACALAVAGERAGLETVLLDLDPQGSATKWGELRDRETPVVTSAAAPRLPQVLTAAKRAGARLAVIDTAPHAADAALAATRAADLVLIPCRASATDLTAIGPTIELARRARRTPVAVLNAAPVRNPLTDETRTAITGYRIETAPVVMHQRIDHVHAWTTGQSAEETAPRGKAAREVRDLFDWIRNGALDLGQKQDGLGGHRARRRDRRASRTSACTAGTHGHAAQRQPGGTQAPQEPRGHQGRAHPRLARDIARTASNCPRRGHHGAGPGA